MTAPGDHDASHAPGPAMAPIMDPLVRELDEKDKVIAQLTRALAQTRDHLGLARSALEIIANETAAQCPNRGRRPLLRDGSEYAEAHP